MDLRNGYREIRGMVMLELIRSQRDRLLGAEWASLLELGLMTHLTSSWSQRKRDHWQALVELSKLLPLRLGAPPFVGWKVPAAIQRTTSLLHEAAMLAGMPSWEDRHEHEVAYTSGRSAGSNANKLLAYLIVLEDDAERLVARLNQRAQVRVLSFDTSRWERGFLCKWERPLSVLVSELNARERTARSAFHHILEPITRALRQKLASARSVARREVLMRLERAEAETLRAYY